MDIVAATFPGAAEAVSAVSDLTSELHLHPDLVTVAPIDDHASRAADGEPGAPEVVVVAWVPEDDRPSARDVLWRNHGRHVPFDWVIGKNEQVVAHAFLVPRSQSLAAIGR